MRRFAPLVLIVALAGCYTYAPYRVATPEPGKSLRVVLTDTGGDSLARFVGPNVATIDGKLVLANDDGLEIGVKQVTMHDGLEQYWKGETVTIPKPYISSVQVKTFSWPKTGLLAGIVVVAVLALQGSGALNGVFNQGGCKTSCNQQ